MTEGGYGAVVDRLRELGFEDRGGFRCPAHGDEHGGSLWVTDDGRGNCKLRCFARGCSSASILAAIGMEPWQLFVDGRPKGSGKKSRTELPEGMQWRRWRRWISHDEKGQRIHFEDRKEPHKYVSVKGEGKWVNARAEAEAVLGVKGLKLTKQGAYTANGDVRWSFEAGWYEPGGGRSWSRCEPKGKHDSDRRPSATACWLPKVEKYLYRLPKVRKAIAAGRRVWLCEGYKDADAMVAAKEEATTGPGGSKTWEARLTKMLLPVEGVHYELWLVLDDDPAGRQRATDVGLRLEANGIHVRVCLPADGCKDAAEHFAAGHGVSDFRELEDWRVLGDGGSVTGDGVNSDSSSPSPGPQPKGAAMEVSRGILSQIGGESGGDGSASTPTEEGAGGEDPDFAYTDWGWAERLVWLARGDLRYVPKWLAWCIWNGLFWERDEQAEAPIHRRIVAMARELRKPIDDAATAFKKWAGVERERRRSSTEDDPGPEPEVFPIECRGLIRQPREDELFYKYEAAQLEILDKKRKSLTSLESANKLKSINGEARKQVGVPAQPEEFDTNPDILTVRNGVIDLRTGELRDGRREDMCSKQIDVAFDPDAQCPTFLAFVDRCVRGDVAMKRYLMKAVGYTLTGCIGEEKFFCIYGEGGTGKSKFIDAIEMMLGPYAKMLMPNKLMSKKFEDEIPTHFAKLQGSRLVKVPEVDDGMRLDESLIKILTGEQKTAARFMRENEFEFKISFKFWMTGNSTPKIISQDSGIWRRPQMIEFSNEVPPEERDPALLEKFRAELPGILAWAVRGAVVWYREGLTPPPQVEAATQGYKVESDQVGRFLEECCIIGSGSETMSSKLFLAFTLWLKRNNEFSTIKSVKFAREMNRKGFDKLELSSGNWWAGVRLRPDAGGQTSSEDGGSDEG